MTWVPSTTMLRIGAIPGKFSEALEVPLDMLPAAAAKLAGIRYEDCMTVTKLNGSTIPRFRPIGESLAAYGNNDGADVLMFSSPARGTPAPMLLRVLESTADGPLMTLCVATTAFEAEAWFLKWRNGGRDIVRWETKPLLEGTRYGIRFQEIPLPWFTEFLVVKD